MGSGIRGVKLGTRGVGIGNREVGRSLGFSRIGIFKGKRKQGH